MVHKVLFSHQSDDWSTPRDLYNLLDAEFHFDFDPCPLYSTYDGLSEDVEWGKSNFINPPYSRIMYWVQRARIESRNGKLCVLLLPSRTDTRWFHQYIYNDPNIEVRFIKGRLKFGGGKSSAPFPSMIVIMSG